jgi:predicted naringenin-chalcone synthase
LLVPASAEAMSWAIEDHGFVMGLSPQVPDLIGSHLRP